MYWSNISLTNIEKTTQFRGLAEQALLPLDNVQHACQLLSLMRHPVATFLVLGIAVAFCVFCVMALVFTSREVPIGVDVGSAPASVSRNLASPVEIEARGRRFKWTFRYPGRDGELGTADDLCVEKELHLPVGVEVELKLESDDFIYILFSPQRGLKQIAVPELTHTLKITTEKIETFDLLTDPLCGWRPLHDDLMGRVVIQSAPDFDAWFDREVAKRALHQ